MSSKCPNPEEASWVVTELERLLGRGKPLAKLQAVRIVQHQEEEEHLAGAPYHGFGILHEEEEDQWAFCWMPAIEDFFPEHRAPLTSNPVAPPAPPPFPQNSHPTEKDQDKQQLSYNQVLVADRSFSNPQALQVMATTYHLTQYRSFRHLDEDGRRHQHGFLYYEDIRELQEKDYADIQVSQGVELNREGRYREAIKLYGQALKMVPRHVDALVARGAAQANLGLLREAAADFELALRVEPDNKNAKSYMQITQEKLEAEGRKHLSLTPPPQHYLDAVRGFEEDPPAGNHHDDHMVHQPVAYSSTIGKLEELIRAEEEEEEMEGQGEGDNGLRKSRKRKREGKKKDRKKTKKSRKHKKAKKKNKQKKRRHGEKGTASSSSTNSTSDSGSDLVPHL